MKTKKQYPLHETGYWLPSIGRPTGKGRELVAVLTGEFRPPHKGEWYLSGATPGAYQAPSDDTIDSYHIVKIVPKQTR